MTNNRQVTRRDEQRDSPFALQGPFNRFFEEAFWDPFRLFESSLVQTMSSQKQWALPVDISETTKDVVIEADIPGFDANSIHVDIANNMLTISGKQEMNNENEDKKWHRRERSYSYAEFTRQILLPEYADASKAECKMKNGTLCITIPKKPETEPRRLDVKVEP